MGGTLVNARMRRMASDYEQIKRDFTGHAYIIVKPSNGELPEKYDITYFVNGIYLLPDGRIETLGRHEVQIALHAEYPRYKPICTISTPIWHPNFRDGQICIGDIWGAGESLSEIIINIGDMIQYKSWNSSSPLSAEAAEWAMKNKHLFPVGSLELRRGDYSAAADAVQIELIDADAPPAPPGPPPEPEETAFDLSTATAVTAIRSRDEANDFDITGLDLAGIRFVPTAQRMQTVQQGQLVQGSRVNLKTVAVKGLLWGFIGGLVGWVLSEIMSPETLTVLGWMGVTLEEATLPQVETAVRVETATFTALVAVGIGALLGVGEGVYYGSKNNALKYMGIGAGAGALAGFVSGWIAQILYAAMVTDTSSVVSDAFSRGFAWAIMGAGIGLGVGLIKPQKRRILFCALGGLGGGFVGGFIFDFIARAVSTGENDTGVASRAVGITIMGLLIGLGIGLLEQFAKQAWLKVTRGEFEGKEYLVFAGTTSIGNNAKNTIVLFKDRLVGPNHCDIVLEGSKYVLVDKGTPMGTVVNGQRITRHVLRRGDTIAIGNSVMVFNTK